MFKRLLSKVPFLAPTLRRLRPGDKPGFDGVQDYWERRYTNGGDSGIGSRGRLARFKADTINEFVRKEAVSSVMEFGCGDGAQLLLADYPVYIGLDVSTAALQRCKQTFADDPSKSFFLYEPHLFVDPLHVFRAELALSIDVIYHLVEDKLFELHMRHLFAAATRFVAIYSCDGPPAGVVPPLEPHVKPRAFSRWIAENRPEWTLRERVANAYPYDPQDPETSWSDFFFYEQAPEEKPVVT